MAFKSHLISLMKAQGLEPVLIVIGGSRARRCNNQRSDVDVFAHHIGGSVVSFDNTPLLRELCYVDDDINVQFISEGIYDTYEHILGRHPDGTDVIRLDRIENFMCFHPIYKSDVVDSVQREIELIPLRVIRDMYRDLSLSLYEKHRYLESIEDKTALTIIRTGLTSLWLQQSNVFTVDVPMLTRWAGIEVDWGEIFRAKNRYRNPVYWLHRIETVVERLQ